MFGAYQAGVWKTLSREITPDIVVGASVGVLNGYYIAAGVPAEELVRDWLDPAAGDMMRFRFPLLFWNGVFDPHALELRAKHLVTNLTPQVDFGVVLVEWPSLRRKLFCYKEVTWRHLVASCSVPGGFPPVRIGGRLYFDGGVLEATPIWAAAEMGATRVIAVNASKFFPPLGISVLIKGVRAIGKRIGQPTLPSEGGPEVCMITPEVELGKFLHGAKWQRERIERWIALGESDGAAALESIRGLRHCSLLP
jgi:NTE family protein